MYNIMTCSGWQTNLGSWIAAGGCMKARLGIIILFFLLAIVRKWGGEEMGIEFNFIIALVAGILPYIIVVTFFGSFQIALLVGIIAGLAGGYGLGAVFGGGGDGGYE